MSFSPASRTSCSTSLPFSIALRTVSTSRSRTCMHASLPSRRNVNIHAGWPSPDWHALHVGLPHVFLTSESAPFASGPIELMAALISRLVEAFSNVVFFMRIVYHTKYKIVKGEIAPRNSFFGKMSGGRNGMDKTATESNLKAERHRNLKIWQEAMTLANEVYTITRAFPRDEVWGLTSQLRRAGVSVPSNIAEGSKRSDPDFRKFLTYSLGSLAELDTQFLIAEMQGYAKYTDELKAKVVGLMAGIRAFSATLSKA